MSAGREREETEAPNAAGAGFSAQERAVHVLILTALQDELDAVLALGDGGKEAWKDRRDRTGFPYHLRTLLDERGQPLVVAAARSVEMDVKAVIFRAGHLIEELNPACLAMCGICAGKRGDVFLGDVILADKVYACDQGNMSRARASFMKSRRMTWIWSGRSTRGASPAIWAGAPR